MNNKTAVAHLVKFPEILGELKTTSLQDLITENAINQAKEMKKQTAVEWLQERLLLSLSDELKSLNGFFIIAKEMEKEQSQAYAAFAIRCDRAKMRILEFNDYVKLYENEEK
jgi:hypothetical protein